MINQRKYEVNSPEWVMAKFFDCWKRRAWKQILHYIQASKLAHYQEPNRWIRQILRSKLISVEFIQVNARTSVVAVFLVRIKTRIKPYAPVDEALKKVKLFREGKKWGVIPGSIIYS